jgi:hypothetical protein
MRAVLSKYRRKNNYRQNTLFGYHTLTVTGIIFRELAVTVNPSPRLYGISCRHFLKTKLTEQQNNRGIWLPVAVPVVISRCLVAGTGIQHCSVLPPFHSTCPLPFFSRGNSDISPKHHKILVEQSVSYL